MTPQIGRQLMLARDDLAGSSRQFDRKLSGRTPLALGVRELDRDFRGGQRHPGPINLDSGHGPLAAAAKNEADERAKPLLAQRAPEGGLLAVERGERRMVRRRGTRKGPGEPIRSA